MVCVRLEMGLEDRRKSFQDHTQYKSVLMLLDCNIPMQMGQQGLNHVQMNVNAMQNLVCQNGIGINLGNLAYLAIEVSTYKVEKIEEDSLDWIPSPLPSVKIQVYLRY